VESDSSRNPDTADGSTGSADREKGSVESNRFPPDGESLFVGLGAVCDTAARLTGVDGAAVAVLSGSVRELVHATDALSQQIDELQFTLGEGPCLAAYIENSDQLWAAIDGDEFVQRWPLFNAEIAQLGVAAVFAFPIAGVSHPMGVLELYRRTPGPLAPFELESARACTEAIAQRLESNWLSQVRRRGTSEAVIEAVTVSGEGTTNVDDRFTRAQVHVAAGMVAVQLKVSTHDGMTRLRAYAYAEGRSVVAIAADVVSRRLSFRDLDGRSAPELGE
jgi:hypothetical protein